MNAWKHFCTITKHKMLVMAGCFRVGLYWQGLWHDMSKYDPTEFLVGCKYYKGYMSPNNAEREERGYSSAWLHHKGRNKHHLEYWIDYGVVESNRPNSETGLGMTGMKMPIRYVVEMFIDRVSASKNYQGESYTDQSPKIYYDKGVDRYMIHKDTAALLELLLVMLFVRGEQVTFSYVKHQVLKGKVPYEKEKLEQIQKDIVFSNGNGMSILYDFKGKSTN